MRHDRDEALLRRLEHRRHSRQTERRLAVLLAVGMLLALVVVELGRGLLAMHGLEQFALTIEQTPPVEVKREVARWAERLNDLDPLVRNAAISAMKVATGKNLAPMPGAWMAWWRVNEATWQYQPPRSRASPAPAQETTRP